MPGSQLAGLTSSTTEWPLGNMHECWGVEGRNNENFTSKSTYDYRFWIMYLMKGKSVNILWWQALWTGDRIIGFGFRCLRTTRNLKLIKTKLYWSNIPKILCCAYYSPCSVHLAWGISYLFSPPFTSSHLPPVDRLDPHFQLHEFPLRRFF